MKTPSTFTLSAALVAGIASCTESKPTTTPPGNMNVNNTADAGTTNNNVRMDSGTTVPMTQACQVSGGLDAWIEGRMAQDNIPGLAAAIVTKNGLAWSKGYGFADIAAQRRVTGDTIFAIMSISKVVTSVGVMQVAESGALDLDADVNSYLTTLRISNPNSPNIPVTSRQLLSHASALAGDDYGVLQGNIRTDDASVQPLGAMLQDLLTPAGSRYNGGDNYATHAPETQFAYSSIGMSLAGYVAESVTGTDFAALTQSTIFDRLGMTNTSWRLTPYLTRDDVAVMYQWVDGTSTYEPIDRFTFADYPAGGIRSSVNEFSRFLIAMINDGDFGGVRLLSAARAAELRDVPFPNASAIQAHGWSYSFGARITLGHGGDDSGASTDMVYDDDTKKGVLLFMNVTRRPNTDEIIGRLMDESDGCN